MKENNVKEKEIQGHRNGGAVLVLVIALYVIAIPAMIVTDDMGAFGTLVKVVGILFLILGWILFLGLKVLKPGEALVLTLFGKYVGTLKGDGFYWVNPLLSKESVTLRARNLNPEPIKVNDKAGNPVLIGMVLVWKLEDTYKALFEIDSQSLAPVVTTTARGGVVRSLSQAFENFVRVQSDAALRQVAGCYAYDNPDSADELTLRSNAEEINDRLVKTLNDRLSMAGIHVVEARINYLAYAPEIAAVMLRRQQADAIIAAREKIVDGAVSMVKMALDKLKDEGVVDLDEERKAAMVSNLLVVLCGDEPAQPVVNSGSLY